MHTRFALLTGEVHGSYGIPVAAAVSWYSVAHGVGGLHTRNPLLDTIFAWEIPTSPKLAIGTSP